jgi:3',5'-cyclic AMP phosphodiesterase CpdA
MIRFIHLSDTHIAADRAFSNYGHRPYTALEQAVEAINALPDDYDFVLHSGDVTEDASAAAYANARALLGQLRKPVYYLVGNHDESKELQRSLLGIAQPAERYDYTFELNGIRIVALDSSKGMVPPGGHLDASQLDFLKQYCAPDGPPLVIWIHHQPLMLGVRWLDEHIFEDNGGAMYLDAYEAFQAIIAPAVARIRGVFFGHVHRAMQTMHRGILYSSAPSTFGQLKAWPTINRPVPAPEEPGAYDLVTIDSTTTQIQSYALARPVHSE